MYKHYPAVNIVGPLPELMKTRLYWTKLQFEMSREKENYLWTTQREVLFWTSYLQILKLKLYHATWLSTYLRMFARKKQQGLDTL